MSPSFLTMRTTSTSRVSQRTKFLASALSNREVANGTRAVILDLNPIQAATCSGRWAGDENPFLKLQGCWNVWRPRALVHQSISCVENKKQKTTSGHGLVACVSALEPFLRAATRRDNTPPQAEQLAGLDMAASPESDSMKPDGSAHKHEIEEATSSTLAVEMTLTSRTHDDGYVSTLETTQPAEDEHAPQIYADFDVAPPPGDDLNKPDDCTSACHNHGSEVAIPSSMNPPHRSTISEAILPSCEADEPSAETVDPAFFLSTSPAGKDNDAAITAWDPVSVTPQEAQLNTQPPSSRPEPKGEAPEIEMLDSPTCTSMPTPSTTTARASSATADEPVPVEPQECLTRWQTMPVRSRRRKQGTKYTYSHRKVSSGKRRAPAKTISQSSSDPHTGPSAFTTAADDTLSAFLRARGTNHTFVGGGFHFPNEDMWIDPDGETEYENISSYPPGTIFGPGGPRLPN
ncbi:hypothetical protein DFP72DRAFT_846739 [Ephemerocybe angulata]|uniref:Uncharacterized protein n=1 Tax=Ephemerocybe angulata TaxID=980116 RepID=A0A8H6M8X5_9AGAR|nr:hypothetical protein DFP72DRAFT_846739 [Tulosesus angulatus]